MEIETYKPGTFCWVELATTDGPAAKKFYGGLFGWEAADSPVGPDMVYTMLRLRGKDVGALYQGAPDGHPQWASYVSVASADETAGKVEELGGTLLKGPFDVMEHGRMATIKDPGGATFCLWQPRGHQGARLANEPGTWTWNELYAPDAGAATAFYTGLFGWGTQVLEKGPAPYTTFLNGERPAGGLYHPVGGQAPMPPQWLVYFAVADCDASAKQARSLGARIDVPPQDIPQIGRFAILADPQGAAFAIIKLTMPPMPAS